MMKIREIKKRALSVLDSNPLSDKFVFFAFLVRLALTILCVISVAFSLALQGNFNLLNPYYLLVFGAGILIETIVKVFFSYSFEKKLLNNSNGTFDFDLNEFLYYIEDKKNIIGPILVYALQTLIVILWIGAAAFISKMINNIKFDNSSISHIFVLLSMLIVSIVTIVFAFYIILSLSMSVYIKIENPDKNAVDCIKESYAMMDSKVFKLFLLKISFIGWHILSLLTLGAIYPFVLVYFHASSIEFYKSIKESEKTDEELCDSNDAKDIYNLNTNSNESNIETEGITNEQDKKFKYRSLCLILTIVLSIATFIGMNFYKNALVINYYMYTKQSLVNKINFNLNLYIGDEIENMVFYLNLFMMNIRLY